jgi:hypothetical protein
VFRILIFLFLILKASIGLSQGYDVFGIGIYDVKFDGSSSENATDVRYERRFDITLIDIGPEQDNFFYLKPFAGIELTSDSAFYLISGIYLEDNIGDLFSGKDLLQALELDIMMMVMVKNLAIKLSLEQQ